MQIFVLTSVFSNTMPNIHIIAIKLPHQGAIKSTMKQERRQQNTTSGYITQPSDIYSYRIKKVIMGVSKYALFTS